MHMASDAGVLTVDHSLPPNMENLAFKEIGEKHNAMKIQSHYFKMFHSLPFQHVFLLARIPNTILLVCKVVRWCHQFRYRTLT